MTVRAIVVVLVAGVVGAQGLTTLQAGAVRDPYGGAGDDERPAVHLLRRSAAAMQLTAYSGTRLVTAWGRTSATTVLVDVQHVPGQGTRLSLRGGDIPGDTATFLATDGYGPHRADTLGLAYLDLLTDSYAIALGPRESVAGRPARMVTVSRAGSLTARLWVDERSGLMLRREVLDDAGRLARESTFIDLDVDAEAFLAHLPPTPPEPVTHRVGAGGRYALQSAGWSCPEEAGSMHLVDIETLDGDGALHLTYSDGLSRMSVFEQRGALDASATDGFRAVRMAGRVVHVREGLPSYAMWEDHGLVFTAVTDGPLDTVRRVVAQQSPHATRPSGLWDRLAAGLTRLGSWTSPLL